MKDLPYKIYLEESEMPKAWYNIKADMKEQHDPFIHPGRLTPCTREDLLPVFCDELVDMELNSTDREIPIPEEIRSFYRMYRPSPVVRAYCLEKLLDTPARIFYKFEGSNTSGSHKLNSAAAQAYYAKKQGLTRVTTETGAGQWGTALSMAGAYFGLDVTVYMVKGSAEQKPYRRNHFQTVCQSQQVARVGGADVQPRDNAFEVADRTHSFAQFRQRERIVLEQSDNVLSFHDSVHIAQRFEQPVAHETAAHRSPCPVQHMQQCIFLASAEHGVHQFQITLADRVQ